MLSERRNRDTASEGSDGDLSIVPIKKSKANNQSKERKRTNYSRRAYRAAHCQYRDFYETDQDRVNPWSCCGQDLRGQTLEKSRIRHHRLAHQRRNVSRKPLGCASYRSARPRHICPSQMRCKVYSTIWTYFGYEAHVQGLHSDHLRQPPFFRRSSPTRCTLCNVHACSILPAHPTRTAT